MTDRELLEFAAKAAGLRVVDRSSLFATLYVETDRNCEGSSFNPLTDDGDALRLAVKLQMVIELFAHGVSTYADSMTDGYYLDIGDNPYAATRRAIVRTAAEIGRNMK